MDPAQPSPSGRAFARPEGGPDHSSVYIPPNPDRSHLARTTQLRARPRGPARCLPAGSCSFCAANHAVAVPRPFCSLPGCHRNSGSGHQHRIISFCTGSGSLSRTRTLHSPTLAANDHLVEPGADRELPRSTGGSRYSLRNNLRAPFSSDLRDQANSPDARRGPPPRFMPKTF